MVWPLPSDPSLRDDTVSLRRSVAADLHAIDAGIHDVDVVRWIGPPEGTAAEILALNDQSWATGSPTLSICERGRCVGLVWINVRESDRTSGSVGYWLVRAARGRGIATAAVRLICCWARRDIGITHLRITVEPANQASRRVAEQSGFRQMVMLEASGTVGDRVIDQVVYELGNESE